MIIHIFLLLNCVRIKTSSLPVHFASRNTSQIVRHGVCIPKTPTESNVSSPTVRGERAIGKDRGGGCERAGSVPATQMLQAVAQSIFSLKSKCRHVTKEL